MMLSPSVKTAYIEILYFSGKLGKNKLKQPENVPCSDLEQFGSFGEK